MSILETLQAERAKYGERINSEQAWVIKNRAAYAHRSEGWGLLSKPSGNSYKGTAQDILVRAGYEYDVFMDAPDNFNVRPGTEHVKDGEYWGTAKPYLSDPKPVEMDRWVAPVLAGDPQPVPEPVPTPEPGLPKPPDLPRPDKCPTADKVAALTQLVNDYIKAIAGQREELLKLAARVEALANDVKLLKSEPVAYEASTSRVWGHSHTVKVKA